MVPPHPSFEEGFEGDIRPPTRTPGILILVKLYKNVYIINIITIITKYHIVLWLLMLLMHQMHQMHQMRNYVQNWNAWEWSE